MLKPPPETNTISVSSCQTKNLSLCLKDAIHIIFNGKMLSAFPRNAQMMENNINKHQSMSSIYTDGKVVMATEERSVWTEKVPAAIPCLHKEDK